MKRYNYKARSKDGKTITGVVEASNASVAAKLMRDKGLIVISLSPARIGLTSIFQGLKSRVSSGDVTAFTRQLATMVNAGLPISEALSILRVQAKSNLEAVLTQIVADVEGGESLSKALGKHPKIFSKTYVALIRSGETGGVLDKVLAKLADDLEKQQEFRGKVKGALIYPIIIIIAMGVVGFIMMVFVMPRLTLLYDQFDTELPIITKITVGVSNAMAKFWPIILLAAGLGFWGFVLYKKTPFGKRKIDQLVFKIPIVGDLQKQIILTELTRTLSLMIGAGVPILESFSIASGVVGNVIISDALNDVASQVEKGFPIAYAFAKHQEAFPFILSQMVAVGEETGKMDEVLSKVSHVFEVESEQKVKALTAAIEPAIMIVLGIGVAFLVISVILPIYNLTTSL